MSCQKHLYSFRDTYWCDECEKVQAAKKKVVKLKLDLLYNQLLDGQVKPQDTISSVKEVFCHWGVAEKARISDGIESTKLFGKTTKSINLYCNLPNEQELMNAL